MNEQIRQSNSKISNGKSSATVTVGEVLEVLGNTLTIVSCVKNDIYNFFPDYRDNYKRFSQKIKDTHDRLYTFSIDTIMSDDIDFLILGDSKEIVGYVGLQKNPYTLSTVRLTQIAIDERFTNHGLSKKLLKKCIERAIQQGMKKFELSKFTALGKKYIPRELYRLQEIYPNIEICVETDGYNIMGIKQYAQEYHIFGN